MQKLQKNLALGMTFEDDFEIADAILNYSLVLKDGSKKYPDCNINAKPPLFADIEHRRAALQEIVGQVGELCEEIPEDLAVSKLKKNEVGFIALLLY